MNSALSAEAAASSSTSGETAPRSSSRALPAVLSWFAVAAGSVLQLGHFLGARSLWLDEAMVAISIRRMSPAELMGKLDFGQIAPVGWLQLEKLLDGLTGRPEFDLRIAALAASLISLVLVRSLAFRLLTAWGALAATLVFAFSPQIVLYAAEVKPYALDVAFAAGSLLLGLRLLEPGPAPWRSLAGLTVLGATAVVFSFPAVFVLAAVGSTAFAYNLAAGRRGAAAALAVSGLAWLALFAALYLTVYQAQSTGASVTEGLDHGFFVRTGFAPLPASLHDLRWYADWIARTSEFIYGPDSRAAGLLLTALGAYALFRRAPWAMVMVCAALPVALVASGLHLYPVHKRLILFLVPSVALLVGAGVQRLTGRNSFRPVIWCALVGLALSGGLVELKREFSTRPPFARQDIRPALQVLAREHRPGEAIYVSPRGIPAYTYYRGEYGLAGAPWIAGQGSDRDVTCLLRGAVDPSRPGVVWLLLYGRSNALTLDGVQPLLADWGLAGEARKRVSRSGAYLYRLDLKRVPGAPAPAKAPARCGRESDGEAPETTRP